MKQNCVICFFSFKYEFNMFVENIVFIYMTRIRSCKSSEFLAGPAFWGLINPEWSLCNKGRRQSPVNLEPNKLLFDPNLRFLHIDKHRVSAMLIILYCFIIGINCQLNKYITYRLNLL